MIRGSLLGGDEGLFKKKRCSISHGQVVRDTLEVLVKLFLLYGDGFEQKHFASHVHGHLRHFPMGWSDFGPFHGELSALFETTEQTSGELRSEERRVGKEC